MNSFKKILVVYFSHSGNTREIARQVQEATGADVFEIVPVDPYPTDYDAVVDQAKHELRTEYRPILKSNGPDLKAFDAIFVGSPNWWSTIAPPVMTWLSAHDLSGKTIVPFITHEGSRQAKSVQDVKRLRICPLIDSYSEALCCHKATWGRSRSVGDFQS